MLLYGARNVDAHREALRRPSNAVYARIHRDGVGDETLAGRTVGLLGFGRIGRAHGRAAAAVRRARCSSTTRTCPRPRSGALGATPASWTAAARRVAPPRARRGPHRADARPRRPPRAARGCRDGAHRRQRGARRARSTWRALTARGALAAGCAARSTSPTPSRCRCAIRCGACAGAILTPHVGRGPARGAARRWRTSSSTTSSASSPARRPRNRVRAAMLERMT